jgi:polar amino acid transport system substrate-binding protein
METVLPAPRRSTHLLLCLAVALLGACRDIPRDPHGTLERVRGGVLRVGLMHHKPWATIIDGRPQGLEAALAEQLAKSLGATVEWAEPRGDELFQALKEYRLDLVVGGITEHSPWKDHVAFTRPYLRHRAAAVSQLPLTSIRNQRVAVDEGTPELDEVRQLGGIPVSRRTQPIAAAIEVKPAWQVAPGEHVVASLEENRQVFAVPSGENAWLVHVDSFLQGNSGDLMRKLREQAP